MRKVILSVVAVALGLTVLPPSAYAASGAAYRPFKDNSYWNTRFVDHAPRDARSADIIDFLKTDNDYNYVRMLGVQNDASHWGKPIFWAKDGDRTFNVRNTNKQGIPLPEEFNSLRIPANAKPAKTSDSDLVIFDRGRGYVVNMWHAKYNKTNDRWKAEAGSAYRLGSNGLNRRLARSDDGRNIGHRGVPPSIMAVRWNEAKQLEIKHMLEVFVQNTGCSDVFPMVANECAQEEPFAHPWTPPEGTVMRIRHRINLKKLNLSPVGFAIARALKRYGALIGDRSGANVTLRVENTAREGKGQLWTPDVLKADALKKIKFDDFEVVTLGYGK